LTVYKQVISVIDKNEAVLDSIQVDLGIQAVNARNYWKRWQSEAYTLPGSLLNVAHITPPETSFPALSVAILPAESLVSIDKNEAEEREARLCVELPRRMIGSCSQSE
jgi:hypothetical protein